MGRVVGGVGEQQLACCVGGTLTCSQRLEGRPWVGRCLACCAQVNGSSHTILAPYWTQELLGGVPEVLHAVACSARGGHLYVKVRVTPVP